MEDFTRQWKVMHYPAVKQIIVVIKVRVPNSSIPCCAGADFSGGECAFLIDIYGGREWLYIHVACSDGALLIQHPRFFWSPRSILFDSSLARSGCMAAFVEVEETTLIQAISAGRRFPQPFFIIRIVREKY